jgi:hypothetical protein
MPRKREGGVGGDPVIIEDPGNKLGKARLAAPLEISRSKELLELEIGIPALVSATKMASVEIRDKAASQPQPSIVIPAPSRIEIENPTGVETRVRNLLGASVLLAPERLAHTAQGGVHRYRSATAGPIDKVFVNGKQVDTTKFKGVSVTIMFAAS